LFFLLACGGGGGGDDAAGGSDAPAATVAALGGGSISGTVNFTGDVPSNPMIDMMEEAECAAKHTGDIHDPIHMVADGKLGNVFVRITAGLPAGPYPMPTGTATINQDGCLYNPRVIGVVAGQDFEITNSDPLQHNIKAIPAINRGFNVSQPQAGMSTTKNFASAEIMVPLECSVHSWMNAYVGVVDHPYFATSGADGSFNIEGLPTGTYTLEAWHETLGTQTAEVTVGADGATSVEFNYEA
jgi:hypothetical protein